MAVFGPALLLAGSVQAQGGLPSEPINNFHTDESLQPACTAAERSRIQEVVEGLATQRNPKGAWAVAEAMFCGKAPRGNMPKLVAQELYGVEEDPGPTFELIAREKIDSLNGVAYGVTIESNDPDLAFNYRTAGICSGGFTIRYVAGQWLLVQIGEACD